MSNPRPTQKAIAANERDEKEREEQEEKEEKEENRLPDDAVVDVEAEKKKANSAEILHRLDQELVGLASDNGSEPDRKDVE
ncbi:MAG: hypothetical protein ACR2KK_05605 [Acidimicrobiales bacterium]